MDSRQPRRGQQFWQEQYSQWQKSDLSRAAFCRQASLSISSFYYWSKKLAAPEVKSTKQKHSSAFMPLSLSREPTPAFSLKVADVTLSCNHPVSSHQLRQWIGVIRSTR